MTDLKKEDLEEEPLDPEMEKVRRKMVRLLAISIGIMFVGLMAVLGAIVYKFSTDDGAPDEAVASSASVPSDAPLAAKLKLPSGMRAISTSVSGDRILVLAENSVGLQQIFVFSLTSGRLVAEIELSSDGS